MNLILNLKKEYFLQIKEGIKKEEYRLYNPYWRKRLEGKVFDNIEICLGYPAAEDTQSRLLFGWNGYAVKEILHPHFGPAPVTVYAISLENPLGHPSKSS